MWFRPKLIKNNNLIDALRSCGYEVVPKTVDNNQVISIRLRLNSRTKVEKTIFTPNTTESVCNSHVVASIVNLSLIHI